MQADTLGGTGGAGSSLIHFLARAAFGSREKVLLGTEGLWLHGGVFVKRLRLQTCLLVTSLRNERPHARAGFRLSGLPQGLSLALLRRP